MLTKWKLTRFKSFKDEDLSLSRLTLLCGANSSGKSTIIQSILLIKQTLQYAPKSRAIALNGPLVRLGTFSDIENFQTKAEGRNQAIGIGWEITNEPLEPQYELGRFSVPKAYIQNMAVEFLFDTNGPSVDNATQEIQPSLRSSSVRAVYRDLTRADHAMFLEIRRSSGQGRKPKFDSVSIDDATDPFAFVVAKVDKETKCRAVEGRAKGKIVGGTYSNFFPASLLVRYDRHKGLDRIFLQSLGRAGLIRRGTAALNVTLPQKAADVILADIQRASFEDQKPASVQAHLFPPNAPLPSIFDFIQRLSLLPSSSRRKVQRLIRDLEGEIETAFSSSLGPHLNIVPVRVEILVDILRASTEFFRFSLSYLGPLRDDPKPLYPLQALQSPTDVGPKGELTAAVLHLNKLRPVNYIPSNSIETNRFGGQPKRAKLGDAVLDWLIYLGVAVEVETSERGKFGHELRIRTSSSGQLQDLTNVGVGVSQVLPIIVTCLLAQSGATIILEQPELHLNPAVQARLADFFISMNLLKKQCIIETHSEHIIERIRYRVACDESDQIKEDTTIYFVEQVKGITHCRVVELTKYGAVIDWPENFFDQSQKESERIVLKALQRRRAEQSSTSREK